MGSAFEGFGGQKTAKRFEQARKMFGRVDEQLDAVTSRGAEQMRAGEA
jgi:hypothetical protein